MIPGKPIPSNRTRSFRTVTVRMSVEVHNKLIERRKKDKESINTICLEAITKHLGINDDNN